MLMAMYFGLSDSRSAVYRLVSCQIFCHFGSMFLGSYLFMTYSISVNHYCRQKQYLSLGKRGIEFFTKTDFYSTVQQKSFLHPRQDQAYPFHDGRDHRQDQQTLSTLQEYHCRLPIFLAPYDVAPLELCAPRLSCPS